MLLVVESNFRLEVKQDGFIDPVVSGLEMKSPVANTSNICKMPILVDVQVMDKSLGLKVAAIRAAIAAPAAGWVSVQVRIGRLCLSYSEGFHKEEMQTEVRKELGFQSTCLGSAAIVGCWYTISFNNCKYVIK
ncbi:hypothetical protein F0562_030722 [Nyssa sinensis]|uniref:Uncharacterized protein n=2 Tax=Nyssa sinensis TaxID=561372 RepID=A0A5J5AZG8_9ASTE|nr:hypothetical protein F0562_030693 [Nyssa sinensis]KAA8535715.1 hypothetical protein F0562_030722 [Nyssa sinensis]